MKKFHKTVTPPRTAFMKSLFRPKKRVNATYFVSRQKRVFILLHLVQVIFYNRSLFYFNHLYCYFAHQCFLFRLKIWHFKALTFLNKRYEIRLILPPPFVKSFHKIPLFFKGMLPLSLSWFFFNFYILLYFENCQE